MKLVVVATVSVFAHVARAQPSAAPGATEPAPSAAAAAEPDPLDAARDRDAASDRAFGLATAIALPAGTVDVSARGASIGGSVAGNAGITLGVGHGVEVYADATRSFERDASGGILGGGAKVVVARNARMAFAITAGVHRDHDSCGPSCGSAGIYSAGAKLSRCIGDSCEVLATAGLDVFSSSLSARDLVVAPNGSVIIGAGPVRALVEAMVLLDDRGDGGVGLGFAGLRVGNRHVAVDAGVGVVAFSGGDVSGGTALPMVGLSLRP